MVHLSGVYAQKVHLKVKDAVGNEWTACRRSPRGGKPEITMIPADMIDTGVTITSGPSPFLAALEAIEQC